MYICEYYYYYFYQFLSVVFHNNSTHSNRPTDFVDDLFPISKINSLLNHRDIFGRLDDDTQQHKINVEETINC